MPEYTYHCAECEKTLTHAKQMTADHPKTHNEVEGDCPGALQRIFAPVGVTYNASGFYSTDKALYGTTPGDYENE